MGYSGKNGIWPSVHFFCELLYVDPIAKICPGNLLSSPFALGRGTRQGCPLSPLLFTLAQDLSEGKVEKRICLYADDILLFL